MIHLDDKGALKTTVVLFISLFVIPPVATWNSGSTSTKLVQNGYEGLVIAIHESTTEDSNLLKQIQEVFSQASETLFRASMQRVCFRSITVLIPTTWRDNIRYKQVRGETFYNADIRVDPRTNPNVRQHNPYVMGSQHCIPGSYMHLTPRYLTDKQFAMARWGDYDRTIVHEWAHLRWGVKDEYATEVKDRFYLNSRGDIEATRCSKDATGDNIVRDRRTGRYRRCRVDPRTNLYESGCVFSSHRDSRNMASIMFRSRIASTREFCDDNNPLNPSVHHNKDAPNEHNRLCGGRSVWEVILSHGDFANGKNRPFGHFFNPPTFKFVKDQKTRIVVVIDVSASMHGKRLYRLQLACENLINTVEDGDWLGLVEFNNESRIVHNLAEVDDRVRLSFLDSLSKLFVRGYTSIGAGLREGLNVLSQGGSKSSSGGNIVLVTDGEENTKPFIATVMGDVLRNGVTVETIGVSTDAEPQLENLAEMTGGSAFFAPDLDDNSLDGAFISIVAKRRRTPLITVKSEILQLEKKTSHITTFTIDSTAKRQVRTRISWIHASTFIRMFLTSPSGVRIALDNTSKWEYNYDSVNQKNIYLKTENAEVGTWKMVIENHGNKSQQMSVYTLATGIAGQDVIDVTGSLPTKSLNFTSQKYIMLRAEVRKGYVPIIYANVTAVVMFETGEKQVVQLRDTGGGCDGRKNDGVYTAFFSNFSGGNGRYSVDFVAHNFDRSAEYNHQSIGLGAPPLNAEDEIFISNVTNEALTEYFERRKTVGSFTVKEYITNSNDVLPPSHITDLFVTSVSSEHRYVTLEWTSPGDDFDVGTAHRFDLRYGSNFTDLFDHFGKARKVLATMHDKNGSEAYILFGNITKPTTSGDVVTVTVQLPPVDRNVYAFGVRAEDEAGNYGEHSNIVTASLKFVEPLDDQPLEYLDQENKNESDRLNVTREPNGVPPTESDRLNVTRAPNGVPPTESDRLNVTRAPDGDPSTESDRLNVTRAADGVPPTTDNINATAAFVSSSVVIFALLIGVLATLYL